MDTEINIIQLSYGKDSLALFPVCEQLGIPIHGAIHAEVWATDDIPADLPPMVEFKAKADEIIKQRWGIEVQHVCATCTADKKYNPNFQTPLVEWGGTSTPTKMYSTPQYQKKEQEQEQESILTKILNAETKGKQNLISTDSLAHLERGATQDSKPAHSTKETMKLTYQDLFYRPCNGKISKGGYRGYPTRQQPYCTGVLKMHILDRFKDFQYLSTEGCGVNNSKNQRICENRNSVLYGGTQEPSTEQSQQCFQSSPRMTGRK